MMPYKISENQSGNLLLSKNWLIKFYFISVVRKLQDFESPYLSLEVLDTPHRIVIRKK